MYCKCLIPGVGLLLHGRIQTHSARPPMPTPQQQMVPLLPRSPPLPRRRCHQMLPALEACWAEVLPPAFQDLHNSRRQGMQVAAARSRRPSERPPHPSDPQGNREAEGSRPPQLSLVEKLRCLPLRCLLLRPWAGSQPLQGSCLEPFRRRRRGSVAHQPIERSRRSHKSRTILKDHCNNGRVMDS